MPLINITTDDPSELDKPAEFPILQAGRHTFVVAKIELTTTSNTDNPRDMIKLEARCQDDGEGKGIPVFDNFLIISEPSDEKEAKAKSIHDKKLAQFIAATGVKTMDEIKAGANFDIDDCQDKIFQAESVVRNEPVYPAELDANGKPKKAPRASIKQYLFSEDQVK